MKTFFICNMQNVKQDGKVIKNALIATQIRYAETPLESGNEFELSEKNKGINIVGLRYIPETDTFEAVDPEEQKEFVTLEELNENLNNVELDILEAIIGLFEDMNA